MAQSRSSYRHVPRGDLERLFPSPTGKDHRPNASSPTVGTIVYGESALSEIMTV
jgi:hypothetical protein